jgi:glycosyltransferase involved in cell wall biosynthesis
MTDGSTRPPPVSVLIPAYNAQATLLQTLQSVERQSFSNLEVIVVDDGSRDQTARIAADFAARDARFRLVRQANAGAAAARNTALALARGEWIAPLDADDLWHPDKLARQMQCLKSAPQATVLVYSWSVDIDERSMVIARRLDLDRFEGDAYAALVLTNFIGNSSVPLIRHDALAGVGGWDASRTRGSQGCEDWQLYLRLAEIGDFALAPGFLIGYRQTPGSMSRQVPQMTRSYEFVMAEAKARHPELPAELFRWSRAGFDFYRFEMLRASAAPLSSLRALISAVQGDPQWLRRRSTRAKLKRWLLSPLDAIRGRGATAEVPQGFDEASPDPPFEVNEGDYFEARRRSVSVLRSNRRAIGSDSQAGPAN